MNISCELKRDRIRVALFAYAYEVRNDPLIPDHEFDALAAKVEKELDKQTDRGALDFWFHDCFVSFTGQWIHEHPELDKIERLYERVAMHFRP